MIHASGDRIVPKALSCAPAAIPAARVAELPGGHFSLLMARHRELAAEIARFLSETSSCEAV
ncbi:MAG: hypothetical protein M0Z88_08620 [Actinomycetota bacterium]|nr:hypothetical protein [Actinomycetota bacterium]